MRLPDFEPGFLGVIIGGTVVKLITSKRMTLWSGVVTVICATFCAVVFTDPISYYLGVSDNSLRYAVAALLVFTGEGLVRFLIDTTSTSTGIKSFLTDIIRAWRGK